MRSGETPLRTPLETEAQWDPEAFKSRFEAAQAQGDVQEMRSLLKGVSSSNYKLTKSCLAQQIPRTELVTLQQVNSPTRSLLQHSVSQLRRDKQETPWLDFAHISKCWGGVVCGLNFANGVECGRWVCAWCHGARGGVVPSVFQRCTLPETSEGALQRLPVRAIHVSRWRHPALCGCPLYGKGLLDVEPIARRAIGHWQNMNLWIT